MNFGCFFSPSVFPRSSPLNFIIMLSVFKIKHTHTRTKSQNGNQNKRQKMPKQIKMRQKVCRNTSAFILCWSTTSWQRACSQMWLINPARVHWRKLTFPLPVGINHRELLTQGRELMSTSFSKPTLFGLNVCGPCVFCPSLCGLKGAPALCL